MKISVLLLVIIGAIFVVVPTSSWRTGGSGALWDYHCDFYGRDIARSPSSGGECGAKCASNSQCPHFTYRDGFCYLKRSTSALREKSEIGPICGFIRGRSSQSTNPRDNVLVKEFSKHLRRRFVLFMKNDLHSQFEQK